MNKFNFGDIKKKLERVKKDLPTKLANETKNYFLSSWDKQGFDGKNWQEVKRRIPNTQEYKRAPNSRRTAAILVGKGAGNLRRDVANSLKEKTFERIRFSVDNDYAYIHNYGGIGRAFGKYSFVMPKRQFIGDTKQLRDKQLSIIKSGIGNIWR